MYPCSKKLIQINVVESTPNCRPVIKVNNAATYVTVNAYQLSGTNKKN